MTENLKLSKVAICGVTGYIGRNLAKHFLDRNIEVVKITRVELVKSTNELAEILKGCEIVYNLTGAPVSKRWTRSYKKEIRNSRVNTTSKIIDAIGQMEDKPVKLVNASAIGIYDFIHIHTEESKNYGTTFLSSVVRDWELAAQKVKQHNVQLVIARIGLVLGNKGGIVPKLQPVVKKGFGFQVGNGKQAVSFIQLEDLLNALVFVAERKGANGIYNMVAPEMSTHRTFVSLIASISKSRINFVIPSFILNFAMGESSILLTKGEKVKPNKLVSEGFNFISPDITNALFYSLD